MSYQPFLISNFATGYDRERQPWLLPTDAQDVLLDGYVYRGVWQKRDGFDQFADGERGGSPYTESRMVHTVSIDSNETPDDIITEFTFDIPSILLSPNPIQALRRGGFRAEENTTADPPVQVQIIQDNGLGGTLSGSDGTINSVINYNTYLATPQSVTFTVAPATGNLVTLQIDVHQGLPVMGVMTYYTSLDIKELIVADTKYVNRYNIITNRLDDISPGYLFTGTNANFFTWTNYDSPSSQQRLLFVNNSDAIQQYDGNVVTSYPVFTVAGTPILAATFFTPTTISAGPYSWATPVPVLPGSVIIKETTDGKTLTDNGFGAFDATSNGSGTIDYLTGAITVTFDSALTAGQTITIDYTPLTDPIETALHIFQMQDRLIILAPRIGGKTYGKRILISGTGEFGDTFAIQAQNPGGDEVFISGAGLIDISDDSFINSADFNRDDLIIFTENSTWVMKYTGNDAVPFELKKLDGSRGTGAQYGTISYLNDTVGLSARGYIGCDGYSVDRTDNKIPRFTFEDIDLNFFNLCNAGKVDEDRDHYLIYPSVTATSPQAEDVNQSDRILITNYEEDNYSIYRIPLSCMGNFFLTSSVTWDDLIIFDSWEEMAVRYSTWDSFIFQKATPIGIGGGHHGEIVSLNEAQSEDYPVRIWSLSGTLSDVVTLVTDFQDFQVGDIIYLTGIQGAVELNGKQGQITQVISSYSFQMNIDTPNTFTFSAYTANSGEASKVIEFISSTKKLNPFVNSDRKVRCGWCYFYVTTSGCALTNVDGTPTDAIMRVGVFTNDIQYPISIESINENFFTINLTSHDQENGVKKWCKVWINQTARFVQFLAYNNQAGAKVQIHAIMPGFLPTGRLV